MSSIEEFKILHKLNGLYELNGVFYNLGHPFTEDSYQYNLEDARFPGKVCAFTGHRPGKMAFYGESDPACLKLMGEIHRQIEIAVEKGFRNFISGMAIGVDQWAAISVLDLKRIYPDIRLYAALPYPMQSEKWFNWQKERYFDLLSLCEKVYVVSEEYSKSAPNFRNAFMIDHADLLIAVYDGKTAGGTKNTFEMAMKKGIETVIIPPSDEDMTFQGKEKKFLTSPELM